MKDTQKDYLEQQELYLFGWMEAHEEKEYVEHLQVCVSCSRAIETHQSQTKLWSFQDQHCPPVTFEEHNAAVDYVFQSLECSAISVQIAQTPKSSQKQESSVIQLIRSNVDTCLALLCSMSTGPLWIAVCMAFFLPLAWQAGLSSLQSNVQTPPSQKCFQAATSRKNTPKTLLGEPKIQWTTT